MQAAEQEFDVAEAADVDKPQLVLTLLSISKSTRALMGLRLAELDLCAGQDELLVSLEEGPKSVSKAAEHLNIRSSTVSKMADRLVGRKLVRRSADKSDARLKLMHLTPAGRDLADRVRALHRSVGKDLADLTAENSPVLERALTTIDAIVLKRLRRLR